MECSDMECPDMECSDIAYGECLVLITNAIAY